MLGDVVSFGAVWVVPVAGEDLTENGVERLLDASVMLSATVLALCLRCVNCIRRLDVPPTEVELGHSDKALDGVLDVGQWQECLGMGHEAVRLSVLFYQGIHRKILSHFVMRSNIDRGSRMKVGRVTRLRSAPGRSCDMMCESTAVHSYVSQLFLCVQLFLGACLTYCCPALHRRPSHPPL